MTKVAGLSVLQWLAGDHANYNTGLFAPDAAAGFTAKDLSALLDKVARETGAPAAILTAQPFAWDGVPNPFAKLSHQSAKQRLCRQARRFHQALRESIRQALAEHARAEGAQARRLRADRLWLGRD